MNADLVTAAAASSTMSQDGTRIAYHSIGRGPSVLVVPGVLSTAVTYARFASALAQRFSVHTVERRGRGLSGPQGANYSLLKEREDLLAVQRATGAPYLVGHSFGGLVALEAARTSPVFRRVALYEPGVSVEGAIQMAWVPAYRKKLAQGRLLDAFVEFTVGTGPDRTRRTPRWLMKLMIPRVVRADDLQMMLSLLPENLREHQALAALDNTYSHYRAVRAEVLLLQGGRSGFNWVKRALEKLSEVLPQAETRTLPALDHFGIDKGAPEEVAQIIGDFFLR